MLIALSIYPKNRPPRYALRATRDAVFRILDPEDAPAAPFDRLRIQPYCKGATSVEYLGGDVCARAGPAGVLRDQRRRALGAGNDFPEARGIVEIISIYIGDGFVLRCHA
jgi:hypothetical protein